MPMEMQIAKYLQYKLIVTINVSVHLAMPNNPAYNHTSNFLE